MVLYGINLFPLAEELREADPGILFPVYVDDTVFNRPAIRSTHLLKLLM